ncbi:methyl-accepting chemotaxis protein [Rubrivivax gelatinosus]|uniref:methyl-accepting chemotaxis protein n=1 Tax=Rubrivivax gelatinosus TaxID=28068 RepID=UPI0018C91522|nr:methyl-accepting chemotaxis protein [Rubrivivax gelatinosus]MBG6082549.1 methyl-accepting chemotaxis protein [Rubrivivax gelatinosus]
MLAKLKIGPRLGLAFGLLVVLMIAMSITAATQTHSIAGNVRYFTTNIVPSLTTMNEARGYLSDRRILEYRHLSTGDLAEKEQIQARIAGVDKSLDESLARYFREDISDDTDRRNTEAFKAAVETYRRLWPDIEAMSRASAGDASLEDRASKLMLGDSAQAFTAADRAGKAWIAHMVELGSRGAVTASEDETLATRLLFVGGLIGSLLGIGAAVLMTRSVVRPLREAVDAANRVAAGDLTQRIEVRRHDETGEMLAALARMQQSLVATVGSVRRNAESVATASAQIALGNQDLSQRTEEQASALQQTAATMSELGETVRHNADNAQQADQLARSASDAASRGGEVVAQVVTTMKGINDSSRRIADIIGTIDGIAFQTNILALNAAVEAARAGEQGRGFAVVAGEVRNLAQRSATAAREIKGLITHSVEQVEQGSTLVDQAGARMDEIVASIRRVSDIVGEISSASGEQSRGVGQVAEAVTQMDQVTQQNAALVEESASAADSLRQQAGLLVEAVSVFRVDAAAAVPRHAPVPAAVAPVSAPVALAPAARPAPASKPAKAAPAPAPAAATAPAADDDWTSF